MPHFLVGVNVSSCDCYCNRMLLPCLPLDANWALEVFAVDTHTHTHTHTHCNPSSSCPSAPFSLPSKELLTVSLSFPSLMLGLSRFFIPVSSFLIISLSSSVTLGLCCHLLLSLCPPLFFFYLTITYVAPPPFNLFDLLCCPFYVICVLSHFFWTFFLLSHPPSYPPLFSFTSLSVSHLFLLPSILSHYLPSSRSLAFLFLLAALGNVHQAYCHRPVVDEFRHDYPRAHTGTCVCACTLRPVGDGG